MLSADVLTLIKTLGNVDDTKTFRKLVLPAVVATVQGLYDACEAGNMQEVQRLVDSGILKAMLDIFADYFLSMVTRAHAPTSEDETAVLQVGDLLLRVLAARACQ